MKKELHITRLATLSRCGVQYERIEAGERIPPACAMIIGTKVHEAIALDQNRKKDTGELASLDEVQTAARDGVAHQFEVGDYWLSPDERIYHPDEWRDDVINWAVRLSTVHHEVLGPILQPTAVEKHWTVDLGSGWDFTLAGTTDYEEGAKRIIDWKTAGRKPSQAEVDNSLQLTMYPLAKKVNEGVQVERVAIGALVKTKKPQAVIVSSGRDDFDYVPLLRRIENAAEVIAKKAFVPANPEKDWWCSPKCCGFWDTCVYVNNKRTVVMGGEGNGG